MNDEPPAPGFISIAAWVAERKAANRRVAEEWIAMADQEIDAHVAQLEREMLHEPSH